MADCDPDYEAPDFDDGLPLARAEIKMMQSLAPEQSELVARWMTLYGYAWESDRAMSGEQICLCFHYSAERLRMDCPTM